MRTKISFLSGCVLLLCLKLALVSHSPIDPVSDDSCGYVYLAVNGYFGEASQPYRPFFYPVFLKFVSLSGLPLRIIMECLHALAFTALAGVMLSYQVPVGACLLAMGLMLFHPFTFGMLNTTYAETLYAPLLAGYAALILWIFHPQPIRYRAGWCAAAGLVYFLLWHTRDEEALHLALAMATAGYALLTYRAVTADGKTRLRRAGMPLIWLILMFCSFHGVVLAINHARWGSWETGQLLNHDQKELLDTLTKIQPNSMERYVQISNDMMERAFAVSPALRAIQSNYEKYRTKLSGSQTSGGEFDGAVFLWVMNFALQEHPDSCALCRQATKEMEEALDRGALPWRFSLGYTLPRDASFFALLPSGLYRQGSSLFRDHSSSFNRLAGIPVHPLEVQQLFDSIIDPHQTHPSYQPLRGWCFIENQLISQLKIYPAATRSYHKRGERLASCSQFSTRPDVLSIFPTTPNSYHSGFVTSPMRHDYNWDELALCLETKDQHSIIIPAIRPNRIQHHTDLGTGARIHYYFQTLPPDPVRQVQLHYQYTWGELYSILILSLTGACLLSWALYWLFQRLAPGYPFSLPPLYGYPLLWLGVVIGLRILFYAAIDAYFYPIPPEGDGLTFHIVGPRFLYPVIVLYPMLLVYAVPYLWLRNGGPIETR